MVAQVKARNEAHASMLGSLCVSLAVILGDQRHNRPLVGRLPRLHPALVVDDEPQLTVRVVERPGHGLLLFAHVTTQNLEGRTGFGTHNLSLFASICTLRRLCTLARCR